MDHANVFRANIARFVRVIFSKFLRHNVAEEKL